MNGTKNNEHSPEVMLVEELRNVQDAGENLARAAARVCHTYDGVHRLRLAISKWYKTLVCEFGRGKKKKTNDKSRRSKKSNSNKQIKRQRKRIIKKGS